MARERPPHHHSYDNQTIICSFKTVLLQRFRGLFGFRAVRRSYLMDTPIDIRAWRAIYKFEKQPNLLEEELPTRNPFTLYASWFKEVSDKKIHSFEELNAVSLSTVGKDMRPSSRMVLLKEYTDKEFIFCTNKTSRKGREIEENPNVALLFYWPSIHRQVRIEGVVEEMPAEYTTDYWNSRPLDSRIGSKSSEQSTVIPSREFLNQKKLDLQEQVKVVGEEAACRPQSWSAFRVIPRYFEFWQGQTDRLHDRIVFTREPIGEMVGDGWHMHRLSP